MSKKVSLSLLFVCGLIALGLAGYLLKNRTREKPPASESERISRLAGTDRDNLIKANAREDEIFAALVRLAQQKLPEARQEAIRRSTSESKVIRGEVANALGYFDDSETLVLLQKLLKDSDSGVRVQAIYAIGRRSINDKETLLLEQLNGKEATAEDRVAVYVSLLQSAGSP